MNYLFEYLKDLDKIEELLTKSYKTADDSFALEFRTGNSCDKGVMGIEKFNNSAGDDGLDYERTNAYTLVFPNDLIRDKAKKIIDKIS